MDECGSEGKDYYRIKGIKNKDLGVLILGMGEYSSKGGKFHISMYTQRF